MADSPAGHLHGVRVAPEPSTRENGCLRVIPGSGLAQVTHPHLPKDRSDLTLNQQLAADVAQRPLWLLKGRGPLRAE